MRRAKLIFVGGFLGAGKTTLLSEAARRLTARGHRVGLITNDQAPGLVDTAFLARTNEGVEEVAGSCFCCNFDGFLAAAHTLMDHFSANVIIAEPVGSCTDLSATILQPIKAQHPEFDLLPISVLTDPDHTRDVTAPEGSHRHASALYILRKQLEEADRIVLSKADTVDVATRARLAQVLTQLFPGRDLDVLSTLDGAGVEEWLDAVLGGGPAGQRVVEVDYDVYAEGEAVLGWLNATYTLDALQGPIPWRAWFESVMEAVHAALRDLDAEVGHVKATLWADAKEARANLTRLTGEMAYRGSTSLTSPRATFMINARAEASPEALQTIIDTALTTAAADNVRITVEMCNALRPGRPQPTHRYTRVV